MFHRVHHEEVGAHGAPVHLAQAGDARLVLHAADVELQPVAHLEAQRFGNALLDADGVLLVLGPLAGNDLVVGRLRHGRGQVELAVHQALGAVVRVVGRAHGLAVHGQQAAPDHGVPVVALDAAILEALLEGVGLLGHDVDHEAVGRIGRRGLAPAADEVGAQQHQQHQGQQAHGQAADLHHGIGRAGGYLPRGQHQPARRRGFVDAAAQQLDRHPAQAGEQRHGAGKAAHGDQSQLDVAAHGQQQCRKTGHAHAEHGQRRGLEPAHVAPYHAQRRHLGQLQHRRQAEGEQQREPHAQAKRHGPQACGRQGRLHQARQQQHEDVVHQVANGHAQRAGEQADQRELGGVGTGNGALALAQHAQHGRGVEVVGGKAARGQRHGHGREQRGQQGHQAQEFLGPVQRLAHFGATALQRLHAHAMLFGLFRLVRSPLAEGLDGSGGACHGKAVGQAAGGLHQAGGGHIGLVEHHARRKAHEAGAPVGLDHDDAGDAQLRITEQQGVAHGQAQRLEQGRINPDLAARGDVARGLLGRTRAHGHGEGAAQRIAGLYAFQGHELAGTTLVVAGPPHGGKAHGSHALQAQGLGALDEGRGRGIVAGHHGIAAQKLQGIALQAALQAVGKKAHGGECGDGQGHGHDQEAQLARAQVAQQGAPAQADKREVHGRDISAKGRQSTAMKHFQPACRPFRTDLLSEERRSVALRGP